MSVELDKAIKKLEELSRLLQQSRDCLREVIEAFQSLEQEQKKEQVNP